MMQKEFIKNPHFEATTGVFNTLGDDFESVVEGGVREDTTFYHAGDDFVQLKTARLKALGG